MYTISKKNWVREYWTLNTYLQLVFSFVIIRVKLLSRHSSFSFIRLKGPNCKQITGEKTGRKPLTCAQEPQLLKQSSFSASQAWLSAWWEESSDCSLLGMWKFRRTHPFQIYNEECTFSSLMRLTLE